MYIDQRRGGTTNTEGGGNRTSNPHTLYNLRRKLRDQLTDPSNPNTTHTRMNKGIRNPPSSTPYYPCIKEKWNARLIMHAHSFTHK